jgi:hypothetical protein
MPTKKNACPQNDDLKKGEVQTKKEIGVETQNNNLFVPLFCDDESSGEEQKKICYYRHPRHLTWQEEEGYSDVVIFIPLKSEKNQ